MDEDLQLDSEINNLIEALTDDDLSSLERVEIGDVLCGLGDPRPGVGTTQQIRGVKIEYPVPNLQFCYIPFGPFYMGSDNFDDNIKPLHQVDIPYGYWISRYPTTILQFKAFVESSNYNLTHPSSLDGLDNYPVANVTWFDAISFCNWLTEIWSDQLPEGYEVTLPSEAEWEKAARGGIEIPENPIVVSIESNLQLLLEISPQLQNPLPQRLYPWGNDIDVNKANYKEVGIGKVCAVGCFPNGVSPYGCLDMTGNAWEWTRSIFRDYPYDMRDGRESLKADNEYRRAVRGGSHFNQNVECIRRSGYGPHTIGKTRDDGFRVAISQINKLV